MTTYRYPRQAFSLNLTSKMQAHHCFLLIFIAAPVLAKNFGSINVAGKGDVYIVSDYKSDGYENVLMHVDGINGFAIRGGGHIYFSNVPSDDFYPEMYWKVFKTIFPKKHCFILFLTKSIDRNLIIFLII